MKIFLEQNKSKKHGSAKKTLAVDFIGSKRLLPPIMPVNVKVDENEIYKKERKECTIVRLTCAINTIASNVLFNNVTEIVKNEGSSDVISYNFSGIDNFSKRNVYANKGVVFTYDDSNTKKNTIGYGDHVYEAVRDTQLSSNKHGYTYHCGVDIFNNHILRSKTFKSVCPYLTRGSMLKEFNTIEDRMRTVNGEQIKLYNDKADGVANKPTIIGHLYLDSEIMTFPESIETNLKEDNGWLGFRNKTMFPMFNDDEEYDYTKVINSRSKNDFIDMYPERDLFSFTPKYNKARKRIEKNWNYCLTYPSSSTTNVPFIREETKSLKIFLFDDRNVLGGNRSIVKFISYAKHGLIVGDTVNIYKGNDIIASNVSVIEKINDYTFTATINNMHSLPSNWIYLGSVKDTYKDDLGRVYRFTDKSKKIVSCTKQLSDEAMMNIIGRNFSDNEDNEIDGELELDEEYTVKDTDFEYEYFYSIDREAVNIHEESKDLSFKKTNKGSEYDYYVRIFSKLPNWRFADKLPTEKEMYKFGSNFIRNHQTTEHEFETHVGSLAFSKNAYNDDITELMFSDDINFSGLRDNLGRPLTEIFLTVVKNNAGYREWYGKKVLERVDEEYDADGNVTNPDKREYHHFYDPNSSIVEYSHCFGKNTCAFKLCDESLVVKGLPNATNLHNYSNIIGEDNAILANSGFSVGDLNERSLYTLLDDDEIEFNKVIKHTSTDGDVEVYDGDVHFYGDLCCYSKNLCLEESIQEIDYRFNTVQREMTYDYKTYEHFFKKMYWDEIKSDDYDGDGINNFKLEDFNEGNEDKDGYINSSDFSVEVKKEGYIYHPHFKIPLRTFSDNLQSVYPIFHTIRKFNVWEERYVDGETQYQFFLARNHNFTLGSVFELYDKTENVRYNCKVTKLISMKVVLATVKLNVDDLPEEISLNDLYETVEVPFSGTKQHLFNLNVLDKFRYQMFVKDDEEIPKYATFAKDGTCRFFWREIDYNGKDEDVIEVYPFANNAFYIEKNFNLFVRRQDKDRISDVAAFYFHGDPNSIINKLEDNHYDENETIC